jgi:hypothetical protein
MKRTTLVSIVLMVSMLCGGRVDAIYWAVCRAVHGQRADATEVLAYRPVRGIGRSVSYAAERNDLIENRMPSEFMHYETADYEKAEAKMRQTRCGADLRENTFPSVGFAGT